jgi:hypothetical protein
LAWSREVDTYDIVDDAGEQEALLVFVGALLEGGSAGYPLLKGIIGPTMMI